MRRPFIGLSARLTVRAYVRSAACPPGRVAGSLGRPTGRRAFLVRVGLVGLRSCKCSRGSSEKRCEPRLHVPEETHAVLKFFELVGRGLGCFAGIDLRGISRQAIDGPPQGVNDTGFKLHGGDRVLFERVL